MGDAIGWILIGLVGAALVAGAALALAAERGRSLAEAAVPPLGEMVAPPWGDGALRVHLFDSGAAAAAEGPPIVLIHGNGGTLRHFAAVLEGLGADRRVLAIDRPGAGYSARPRRGASSLSEQAAVIRAALAERGVDRALYVGHSYGGSVALAAALDAPESVAGLVLAAPGAFSFEPPAPFNAKPVASGAARFLLSWTLAPRLARSRGPEIVTAMFAPDAPPPDYATRFGGLLGLKPEQSAAVMEDTATLQADLAEQAPRYGDIAAPTAIVFGSEDALLDAEAQGLRLAQAIPGATYESAAGRGHMLPITDPDAVLRAIDAVAARARSEAQ